jgi:hypothetical protein
MKSVWSRAHPRACLVSRCCWWLPRWRGGLWGDDNVRVRRARAPARGDQDNGVKTTYTLDAAGNRTQVDEQLPVTAPGSISVPASSLTGSYNITWTAAGATVATYELWESTSSSFATQTRVYTGTGLSLGITGKGNGTFYYRVRGCNGSACTPYRPGGNGVVVTVPPGAPASITVPSTNTSGSYSISWGAATGTLTAYKLEESTTSNFAAVTEIYSGTALTFGITGKAAALTSTECAPATARLAAVSAMAATPSW